MLISHERGMVYLAHPKTASQATEDFLVGLGGFQKCPDDGDIAVDAAGTPRGHHRGLYTHPGEDWLVFTTVRNHWDLWVSWYHFQGAMGLPFGIKWLERFLGRYPHYYPEPDRLWALHDTFADRVMRFEHIESDLASVLREPVKLSLVNVGEARRATGKKHYSEFYDEATREYVAARWKDEIKRYGYSYQREEPHGSATEGADRCPKPSDYGIAGVRTYQLDGRPRHRLR